MSDPEVNHPLVVDLQNVLRERDVPIDEAVGALGSILLRLIIIASKTQHQARLRIRRLRKAMIKQLEPNWDKEKAAMEVAIKAEQEKRQNGDGTKN